MKIINPALSHFLTFTFSLFKFDRNCQQQADSRRKLMAIAQRLAGKMNIPKKDRPNFLELSNVQIQWWIEIAACE